MELFNERLRRLRKAKGFDAKHIAERLNVSTAAVAHWESGRSKPQADHCRMLSRMLSVSLDILLTGQETPELAALHRAIRAQTPHATLLAMVERQERGRI